eukprot:COSAG01_NODE_19164_length_1026_cov_4.189860_2_plen_185_part_01
MVAQRDAQIRQRRALDASWAQAAARERAAAAREQEALEAELQLLEEQEELAADVVADLRDAVEAGREGGRGSPHTVTQQLDPVAGEAAASLPPVSKSQYEGTEALQALAALATSAAADGGDGSPRPPPPPGRIRPRPAPTTAAQRMAVEAVQRMRSGRTGTDTVVRRRRMVAAAAAAAPTPQPAG